MVKKAIIYSVTKSDIKWSDIDKTQLVRYVAMNFTRDELKKAKLSEIVPEPMSTTTTNSMANPKDRAKETDGASQFKPVTRRPNPKELKKLIAYAVAAGVKVCMNNHYYTINGTLRRQLKGGAIGSELTGDVSRNYMLNWDNIFRRKLKGLGIHLEIYK